MKGDESMTKDEFMRKFHDNHWDYDYENKVITLGHQMYCHMEEDQEGIISFLIYSDKTKENVLIKYNLMLETIFNMKDISALYQDRDLYIGLYGVLGFLEMMKYETFSIEHIYKFGWLIDMAMFNPPKTGGDR